MAKKSASQWQELCSQVEKDDGLPCRVSGFWAEKKLHFWNRYIEITTRAMVGHPAWPNGLAYVDLFAGPGICIDRNSGERFPGSPLIAANAPKPFERILLCDLDRKACEACRYRINKSPAVDTCRVFHGDCNDLIEDIVKEIPERSLTLAFLDPTGLHLDFKTVQRLSSHGPVDLLILFPDAVDILRNMDHVYFDQTDSNLDRALGEGSNWRIRKAQQQTSNAKKMRELFSEIYKEQLRAHAGYTHFAHEVISGRSGPLYRLIYATKHNRGIDFWNKSVAKELGGQTRLF